MLARRYLAILHLGLDQDVRTFFPLEGSCWQGDEAEQEVIPRVYEAEDAAEPEQPACGEVRRYAPGKYYMRARKADESTQQYSDQPHHHPVGGS